MNQKKRKFIHQLAEHYGLETRAFDPEPQRHVQVTARHGLARLPGGTGGPRASLSGQLAREFTGHVTMPEPQPGMILSTNGLRNTQLHSRSAWCTGRSFAAVASSRPGPFRGHNTVAICSRIQDDSK
ncbi:unnamed protein product [Protopolystoma xenopodis]|uniref:R3H domain-containing protein n=1 Tax=Protopolystoma xenopodis TaxID=117903 RepID=A0A3S5CNK0_9PLAT|nr:unnamed protein product [Protopolystoma xenopodis]